MRRASGYRDYGPAEQETVHRIRMLNDAGLKLELIRRFLPCVKSDRRDFDPCPDLLAALRTEVCRLDERIGALEQSRQVIGRYLQEVEAGV